MWTFNLSGIFQFVEESKLTQFIRFLWIDNCWRKQYAVVKHGREDRRQCLATVHFVVDFVCLSNFTFWLPPSTGWTLHFFFSFFLNFFPCFLFLLLRNFLFIHGNLPLHPHNSQVLNDVLVDPLTLRKLDSSRCRTTSPATIVFSYVMHTNSVTDKQAMAWLKSYIFFRIIMYYNSWCSSSHLANYSFFFYLFSVGF